MRASSSPKRLAAALALHREDHRAVEALEKAAQIVQRRLLLGLHRQIRQRAIVEINVGGFVGQRVGPQLHPRPLFQLAEQRIGTQPQRFRRQQQAHRIDAAVLKARPGVGLEAVGAGLKIAGADQQRVLGK